MIVVLGGVGGLVVAMYPPIFAPPLDTFGDHPREGRRLA